MSRAIDRHHEGRDGAMDSILGALVEYEAARRVAMTGAETQYQTAQQLADEAKALGSPFKVGDPVRQKKDKSIGTVLKLYKKDDKIYADVSWAEGTAMRQAGTPKSEAMPIGDLEAVVATAQVPTSKQNRYMQLAYDVACSFIGWRRVA